MKLIVWVGVTFWRLLLFDSNKSRFASADLAGEIGRGKKSFGKELDVVTAEYNEDEYLSNISGLMFYWA